MTRRVLRGFTPRAFLETRQRRGLSQADLARLADLGLSTIKAWESGRRSPQVDLLKRAMDILETPIDEVVLIAPADRYPGDWRVIQGMTQPQLAAAAKIATSTLREIESAELALTDANASTLAHVLGIPTDTYRTSYRRARTRPAGTSA